MDPRGLFLATFDDLAGRCAAGYSEYDAVRAAGLIRQLILDGAGSLAIIVNREHKLRLSFLFGRSSLTEMMLSMEPKPAYHWRGDGIYPHDAPPSVSPVALGLDQFLKETVALVQGARLSVADVIRYTSHVAGGVHAGAAGSPEDKALEQLGKALRIGGASPEVRTVRAIGLVVLDALRPLRDVVAAADSDHEPG